MRKPDTINLMPPIPRTDKILDAIGIDQVLEWIGEEVTVKGIAERSGVSVGSVCAWLSKDFERSARTKELRSSMALHYEEDAQQLLQDAKSAFQLAKAKELAHHKRWKAARLNARDYGDRVTQEHTGPGGGPMQIQAIDMSDDELAAIAAQGRSSLALKGPLGV